MSSIRFALEKLDNAIEHLDASVTQAEQVRYSSATPVNAVRSDAENVVDVDFIARRLDKAIATVEALLIEDKE